MNQEMQLQAIPLDSFVSALLALKGPMSYTQKQAAEHGLKAGNRVIVLTIERKDGSLQRSLFLYWTEASHVEGGLQRDGIKYSVSREPWSGSEPVCFGNGD